MTKKYIKKADQVDTAWKNVIVGSFACGVCGGQVFRCGKAGYRHHRSTTDGHLPGDVFKIETPEDQQRACSLSRLVANPDYEGDWQTGTQPRVLDTFKAKGEDPELIARLARGGTVSYERGSVADVLWKMEGTFSCIGELMEACSDDVSRKSCARILMESLERYLSPLPAQA